MKHTQLFNQLASTVREDRRKHPRITVAVQAELRLEGLDVPTRVETVDLSAIYQRAWPDQPLRDASVAYLGIVVAPGPAAAVGYVAGIILSR